MVGRSLVGSPPDCQPGFTAELTAKAPYIGDMAKKKSVYACTECGAQQPRLLGRCPDCGGWDCLVEEASGGAEIRNPPPLGIEAKPQALGEVAVSGSPGSVAG